MEITTKFLEIKKPLIYIFELRTFPTGVRKPIHFYIFVVYNNRSICTYCLPSFVLSLANNYIADDKNNRHTLKYESNDKGGIQVPLNGILCFD